jgi:hypothetical protein
MGQEIVRIWETGLPQHPLDRALTILMAAFPETSWQTLASLSIGQRDACLFAIREQTFGPILNSLATCPVCQEQVEFALNTREVSLSPNIEAASDVFLVITDEGELHCRLPNSFDLAAIVSSSDTDAARKLLARRCVLHARRDEQDIAVEEIETLPETMIAAMAAQMEVRDSLAAIDIPLECVTCTYSWHILFDIVSFFWTELAAEAKRLMREVHTLAREYGWHEADILAMSAIRRQFYLEMVS